MAVIIDELPGVMRSSVVADTGSDDQEIRMNQSQQPITVSPKRPSRWSLRNWPVRGKVFAIVAIPLVLALAFGGAHI